MRALDAEKTERGGPLESGPGTDGQRTSVRARDKEMREGRARGRTVSQRQGDEGGGS